MRIRLKKLNFKHNPYFVIFLSLCILSSSVISVTMSMPDSKQHTIAQAMSSNTSRATHQKPNDSFELQKENKTNASHVSLSSPSILSELTNNYLTYQNSTLGMQIRYPSNWIKNNTISGQYVLFDSPQTYKRHHLTEVRVLAGVRNSSSTNLTHTLNDEINTARNYTTNFHLISSNTTSSLAGQHAYRFEFTYSSGSPRELIETGTVVDSKVYYIQALSVADQYRNYFQTIQMIIDSFKILPPNAMAQRPQYHNVIDNESVIVNNPGNDTWT